jgi:hypothetical protein
MYQLQLLFDHLVCSGKQRRRHRKAEALGNFEVDDELEFCRLRDGQIGWFLAF